eukprot:11159893-Lingulodinium_polyedra.AAC.1
MSVRETHRRASHTPGRAAHLLSASLRQAALLAAGSSTLCPGPRRPAGLARNRAAAERPVG